VFRAFVVGVSAYSADSTREATSMSSWDRAYEEHALWAKSEALRSKTQDLDISDDEGDEDEDNRDTLNYILATVDMLLARRADTPALLVTPQMLDAVANAVDQVVASIDNWQAGSYTASNVDDAVRTVIANLGPWPAMSPSGTEQSFNASARRVGEVADEVIEEVEAKRDELQEDVAALETQATQLKEQLEAQQAQLDAAISTFGTESKAATDTAVQTWTDERQAQRDKADDRLDTLADLEKQAREMVHAATGSTVATDYGEYARRKTKSAWICDIAAAALGAAGVTAILIHLFSSGAESDSNVGLSMTRLAASIGTLGVAALVGHRGAEHHKEARAAKRTDLAIRRVGPFIANLPPDARERIVIEVTDRIFIRGELDEGEVTPADTSLWDRIKAVRAAEAADET
jgi:hypothetical protein